MFSGGLLSRNIAGKFRSPAPDASQTKSIQEKNKNKPTGSNLFPKRAGDSKLINWCESDGRYRRKFIREVNSRPTYTIQVPGNIKLLSPGGGIAILGALFLIAGSVLTWLLRVSLCGPVGVGIGLFIILVATTLILENRNSSNKLVH
uniref:Uncharacterized protein n=1 Tax=Ciona savignyi TaxID=51511 RepID=H2YX62_CIOSA